MNDIKARIKSVESTMQITKAMELVATSKLRRAKEKVERSRPFCDILINAIGKISSVGELTSTPWYRKGSDGKTLFVVIAGDRGLAGGYNANVFRMTEVLTGGASAVYLPIGKKAVEYYRHRKKELFSEELTYAQSVGVGCAMTMAERICKEYLAGNVDRVVLVYTKFKSMISQVPLYEELLPLEKENSERAKEFDPIFEEDGEELLSRIVPEYVGGVIYSAVCEALASESGARRSAMNAANKNAEEMIDTLMLKFNRARQAVITQEITEIVSGAEAL